MSDQPAVYTIQEICVLARAGRTSIYAAISSGALTARKRGSRTVVLAGDLQRWLEAHPVLVPKKI
jgi:excisionase family DNA binding protein